MALFNQHNVAEKRPQSMEALLALTVERDASDLHLLHGQPPILRINGDLKPFDCQPYRDEDVLELLNEVMPPRYARVLEENRSVDFAFSSSHIGRFRFAAYYQRGALSVAIRLLAKGIPNFQTLGLPASTARLPTLRDGMVLVTGVTGSGKSTTLAAIIDAINRSAYKNIITIEDPIEYIHQSDRCIINQRELHTDVLSFPDALRAALRADPDVILVGEIRDLETMRTAIMAAETGHLVFATLHSKDAMSSVNRMVGAFPAGEQSQIRQQLSSTLRAVLSQRLLPARRGGRVPAVEIMFASTGIANLLRLGKDDMIYSAIETGQEHGMQTMEQSIMHLLEEALIEPEVGLAAAKNPDMLRSRMTMRGIDVKSSAALTARRQPSNTPKENR